VTVEPRRRKFHKPITLTIPVPQAANKGMINQYSGDAPTLRLLCSITGKSYSRVCYITVYSWLIFHVFFAITWIVLACLLIHPLTLWYRVFCEALMVIQQVTKFSVATCSCSIWYLVSGREIPLYYGSSRFFTLFAETHHRTLFWLKQFMHRQHHSLILSSGSCLFFPSGLFTRGLTTTYVQMPFAKFVDSPYYSNLELCGGVVVVVSFLEYLP